MSVTERLDAYQRAHRWASFPLAVTYKFGEDQGPYLAALITYYGFLSMFPLLLLLASVLGFVLQGNSDLQLQILDSTLSQFPVIGEQLDQPQGLRGSVGAIVVGGIVAIYGALGVAQAVQNAMNVAWSVPRNRRPNPIRARVRSLHLIGVAGIAVVLTTVLSALGGSGGDFGVEVGILGNVVAIVIAVAVNLSVFVLAFRITAPPKVRKRDLLPGALFAAAVWQLLQLFGTAYVGSVVKDAGATYGAFALVLGLFAWIFLASIGIVVGAELNVVRAKRLYPRALMTPFTDNVDLTAADQRAYADAAQAQQFKGFESVTVSYENDGQHATAQRRARARARATRRGVVEGAPGHDDDADDVKTPHPDGSPGAAT